jgi:hypothetical protein
MFAPGRDASFFCRDCCSYLSHLSTDLGGVHSLMLDKHAHVANFVLACDEPSTLANWDNLRLLDSESLGEHLLDRLLRRREHYKGFLSRRRLLALN